MKGREQHTETGNPKPVTGAGTEARDIKIMDLCLFQRCFYSVKLFPVALLAGRLHNLQFLCLFLFIFCQPFVLHKKKGDGGGRRGGRGERGGGRSVTR